MRNLCVCRRYRRHCADTKFCLHYVAYNMPPPAGVSVFHDLANHFGWLVTKNSRPMADTRRNLMNNKEKPAVVRVGDTIFTSEVSL